MTRVARFACAHHKPIVLVAFAAAGVFFALVICAPQISTGCGLIPAGIAIGCITALDLLAQYERWTR